VRLLVLAAFLLAQDKPPQTCALSGKVVDALTGEPLAKVQLRLESRSNSATGATTSDQHGNFAMAGIEPGTYHLKGIRSGYLETTFGAKRTDAPGTALRLEPAQELKDVALRMTPFSVIAGTVRDREGEPLAGTRVNLWRWRYYPEANRRSLQSSAMADTDDLGHYRFANLTAGKYYVEAQPAGVLREVDDRSAGESHLDADVRTLYPGVEDSTAAAPITVAAGEKMTTADITMVRARLVKVRGHATSEPGLPPPTVVTLINGRAGEDVWDPGYHAVVKDGAFEVTAPPGTYSLIALAVSGRLRREAWMAVAVPNQGLDEVRIVIGPGAEITVKAAMEGDEKFKFDFAPYFDNAVRGVSADLYVDGGYSAYLYPGHYQVRFTSYTDPNIFLKSATLDGVDVLASGFTITVAGQRRMELLVSRDSGQAIGTAIDDDFKPVAGATVLLVPKPLNMAEQIRVATADQNGRFEFKGVSPGDYRALAFDDVEPGAWLDPAFWKARDSQGEPVTVRRKESAAIRLRVVPD
jgi:protocatechuate 3,4-dioxygenase beta subunit